MRLFPRLAVSFFFFPIVGTSVAIAQNSRAASHEEVEELRQTVRELAMRVSALEDELHKQRATEPMETASLKPTVLALPHADIRNSVESVSSSGIAPHVQTASSATETPTPQASPQPTVLPTTLPSGATLNYLLDAYYDYDFEHPLGRVQYLRAYDVLSNAFSINQADIVFDWQPDLAAGRRYGMRVDLQFGQASETLQGNPVNEPRPEIYRNIFQAYGTYVVPLGKGLNVDFGKWASSLGAEGNYSKDQWNYSRSYYYYYLPFYHSGVRASYKLNDNWSLNYWLVNGTNQSEPTNSFKDEMFGFAGQPVKNVSWTFNYYFGQDHPDSTPATNCTAPVQPGLCLAPIIPAPNGKTHIFDTYATWNASPNLSFQLEGDYVIQREWANAAPGESSAPSHTDGGAGYVKYQFTPKTALSARAEYLSDRGGLFSGTAQALKEVTGTYSYNVGDGFLARLEFRRDWSNVPYFLTNKPGVLSTDQPTLTVGLVWWYGAKQGAW